MKYNLELVNSQIEEGWIESNRHPTLPLTIYNYTRKCTFEKHWNYITMDCRGLILHDDGTVIARPFPKFYNMEEMDEIPTGNFEVFEKMDGSLGILFKYEGNWIIASRGSFTSDQAKKATEMLSKYNLDGLNHHYTFVCEIIYPENRIVVSYGDREELVLLGAVHPHDGNDIIYDWLKYDAEKSGMGIMKQYANCDFKTLKDNVPHNAEGYVLRFENGVRMKIKGEEYCRLHRVLTEFSNIDLWDCLRNNDPIDKFLDRVPDEYDKWVHDTMNELVTAFEDEKCRLRSIILDLGLSYCWLREGEPQNREIVEFVKANTSRYDAGQILLLLKRRSIDAAIWRKIRPKYKKPFWLK